MMTITYNNDLIQGTDEWLAARCGILTASEMKLIMTPGGKVAQNDKSRAHVYEIAAQRITNHVEPTYVSNDMLRGRDDEVFARTEYMMHYADVADCGFVTNDQWGFTIGYSPDGLVGDDGLIECKSRRQKYQIQTIVENLMANPQEIPEEFSLQCQAGLLVTGRKWIDLISYSGGLPMATIRVLPDYAMQERIIEAATSFEAQVNEKVATYVAALNSQQRLIETKRRMVQEIFA